MTETSTTQLHFFFLFLYSSLAQFCWLIVLGGCCLSSYPPVSSLQCPPSVSFSLFFFAHCVFIKAKEQKRRRRHWRHWKVLSVCPVSVCSSAVCWSASALALAELAGSSSKAHTAHSVWQMTAKGETRRSETKRNEDVRISCLLLATNCRRAWPSTFCLSDCVCLWLSTGNQRIKNSADRSENAPVGCTPSSLTVNWYFRSPLSLTDVL